MPTNHGIHRKLPATSGQRLTTTELPVCRYGIRRIFIALSTGQFTPNDEEHQKAKNLEHHFYTVFGRFVFSMQDLNRLMHEHAECYSNNPLSMPSMNTMGIIYQSGCLADHVLSYLNTIIDDVAMMTAQAMGVVPSSSVDSMNNLYMKRNHSALAPVKMLLDEFDIAGSWWKLGFQRGQGARQQLVHNQHLVQFQAYMMPGMPYQSQAFLIAPYGANTGPAIDFFGLLRDILSALFNWLDRLELALTNHLRTKSANWSPMLNCPCILLPVGYPPGATQYDADYFPIPLCDGSDALPWTVNVEPGPRGIEVSSV
jgi:hypothetical protein